MFQPQRTARPIQLPRETRDARTRFSRFNPVITFPLSLLYLTDLTGITGQKARRRNRRNCPSLWALRPASRGNGKPPVIPANPVNGLFSNKKTLPGSVGTLTTRLSTRFTTVQPTQPSPPPRPKSGQAGPAAHSMMRAPRLGSAAHTQRDGSCGSSSRRSS